MSEYLKSLSIITAGPNLAAFYSPQNHRLIWQGTFGGFLTQTKQGQLGPGCSRDHPVNFFQYLQWLGFCWFQRVLLAKISLNTHSRIWTQPQNIAASVLFCRCVSLWIDKFTFIFKGQTMNFLPPQQRFQCSQWISSGEHLAVNSSRTVTFWLPVVKGKNTMRDVAYGKLKELTKQSLSLSFQR